MFSCRCVGVLATARVCFGMAVRVATLLTHPTTTLTLSTTCVVWPCAVVARRRHQLGPPQVFHGLMALLMIRVKNSSDFRAGIQDGWWLFKLVGIVGITVAAFFIPNEFFVVFGWIALFGAAGFIIIQLVYLIEFAYSWYTTHRTAPHTTQHESLQSVHVAGRRIG